MTLRPSLCLLLHLRFGSSFPRNSDLESFGPSWPRTHLHSKFTALAPPVRSSMLISPIATKPTSSLNVSVKNDIVDSTPPSLLTQGRLSPQRLKIFYNSSYYYLVLRHTDTIDDLTLLQLPSFNPCQNVQSRKLLWVHIPLLMCSPTEHLSSKPIP